jgi:hypothetical protein
MRKTDEKYISLRHVAVLFFLFLQMLEIYLGSIV